MLQNEIEKAVTILKNGGLVAFPTETVYGLGANANDPEAVKKIFQAKKRPANHPLIVHIAETSQLTEWAVDISPAAYRLADAFWPGPLTLILKKASHVSDFITGSQATIGLRIPNHPVAAMLLKHFGSGLAAPSANRFQRISPTTAEAVIEELQEAVDLVLDGGQCEVGVESTIVDMSDEHPMILRPGMISAEQIEAVLGHSLLVKKSNLPRVSGSHALHYAPETATVVLQGEALLAYLKSLEKDGLSAAVLIRTRYSVSEENKEIIWMPEDAREYAHILYKTLRSVDKAKFSRIVIEGVPNDREWAGVYDRLCRVG